MSCPCGCASPAGCSCGGSCGCRPNAVLLRRPALRFAELRGLIYRKRRRPGLAPQTFVHFFDGCRPLLLRSRCGRRLYIAGGKFRITRRGIVG